MFTFLLKGTVVVILNDPPLKKKHVRFKTVPLKSLSDQLCGR